MEKNIEVDEICPQYSSNMEAQKQMEELKIQLLRILQDEDG